MKSTRFKIAKHEFKKGNLAHIYVKEFINQLKGSPAKIIKDNGTVVVPAVVVKTENPIKPEIKNTSKEKEVK